MYLNCHTYYSLKYGTIAPQKLLKYFLEREVQAFVLADINNTSAIIEMLRLVDELPIKVIPGIDFRNGVQQQFVGIAINNNGFATLNRFLSKHLHAQEPFPDRAPELEDVIFVYPFSKWKTTIKLRDYEYVGVGLQDLSRLPFSNWKNSLKKLVVLQTISFANKREYNAHRILRAIDNNALLSQLPTTEQGSEKDVFIDETTLKHAFEPYPDIVFNTHKILKKCNVVFDFKGSTAVHNNLKSYTENEALDYRLMRKLCFEGLPYRYDAVTDVILDRLNKELTVIKEKGFVSYFLIAWKVLKYARSRGYFYVGRGSGANSIVAYIMRITDVDPIELDLYFERFINLFRKSPPDFDIDFSWKDREDVTRYIFSRFPNVCLLGAYSTFKHRSVIREIGKTFGVPDHEIKLLQQGRITDKVSRLILKYASVIQGFPSHLTVHSAGILVSEKPIYHYTATFFPPKGFATTHFDMHTAEDIGLYKFDILGQRGLAKVKDAIEIIKQNRGITVDVHDMKKMQQDRAANDLLRTGSAIGCFYVESPAMRMLLSKLEVGNYLGLVAASSVIRPGVAQSGMMREYILRHRDLKRREWAKEHFPLMYELMPETYGVMVYQEDVIKVAHYFAGLTLAEADVLRRGMSGKYRSREEFKEVKDKFFGNCNEKGIDVSVTQDIWRQIESFAGYAFAKGHSASYAVESYQCLYLKAYYPMEFMAATINNGGGFYSPELYLHEARKHGAKVHLPCINQSELDTVIYENDIYLGLAMIIGLEADTIRNILCDRQRYGFYRDLRDLVKRVSVSIEQLSLLIRSDVFAFTGKRKKELLWDAHFLLSGVKKETTHLSLFDVNPNEYEIPELWKHRLEDLFDEIELFGFPVTVSPFSMVKEMPDYSITSRSFSHNMGKEITLVGYLIHVKTTVTKNGDRMCFGTLIDLEGEWIDTVLFPQVIRQYPFTGPGCYLLHGRVVEEFGFYSLELIWQKRIPSVSMDDEPSTRLKIVG